MPNCQKLGLGNINEIKGLSITDKPLASYGKMACKSIGKDSTTGHWEIAGIVTDKPAPLFPNGFPDEIVNQFEQESGVNTIGNCTANGMEIIERLGEQHMKTGELIVYTSADSVFQVAAHEEIYPLERQYEFCKIAREILVGEFAVSRVIARPFVGEPGNFNRTASRKDFSVTPPKDTILNLLEKSGHKVLSIGKIFDLFAGSGITNKIKTTSNDGVMLSLKTAVERDQKHQLIFANLVDFDMLWGHRRDVKGFAGGLEKFDSDLGIFLSSLRDNDLLIITADHGCDPTYEKHTDHTREYVPLLVYGKNCNKGVDLGARESFSDIAATIKEVFQLDGQLQGQSFLKEIFNE